MTSRYTKLVEKSSKTGSASPNPKLVDRYLGFIFGAFRHSHPQHIYGRDPKYQAEIQVAIEELTEKHKLLHPDKSSPEALRKYQVSFLCAARKSLYDKLSPKEKAHWQSLADQTAPISDEDLYVAFLLLARRALTLSTKQPPDA